MSAEPFPPPPLALVIAFRSGWQRPFRDADTLLVYRDGDRALLAELPASFVTELVAHYLRAHALQARMVEHLAPRAVAEPPPPPARDIEPVPAKDTDETRPPTAWTPPATRPAPRLRATDGRRLRGYPMPLHEPSETGRDA